MTTTTYSIPNINCNHCVHTIKSEIAELEGVKEVEGDVQQKKVTITYGPPTTEKGIVDLLTEINYPPEA